jgi:hypothetical protein
MKMRNGSFASSDSGRRTSGSSIWRARAFYQRLGFGRTGETDTHALIEWGAWRRQP